MRQTAIVTGAAQGIGRSIALRLAADGMNVTLNDLHSNLAKLEGLALEIRSIYSPKGALDGPAARVIAGDVSLSSDVQKLVNDTVVVFGTVNVMVANAGVLSFQAIQDVSEDDWDKLMSINLRGPMLCFKYAARQMIAQGGGGSLIAASSVAGRKGDTTGPAYCASKFAVRGLVHASAKELGKHGIRVNAYAPGYIDTPMARSATDSTEMNVKNVAVSMTPLGRGGLPEDVSNLVSFLASSQASFITGQTYGVCGGFFMD